MAHVKVTERGQEANLMSEFDEADIVLGGYQENKGQHWSKAFNETTDLDEIVKV